MPVPPWLEPLLSTTFFIVCRIHGDAAARGECNMYCLDYRDDSFCFYCHSCKHKNHQVIKIRRSSYHVVVRVTEIHKKFDITGAQTYVINSASVLFLNQRPQPKSGKLGVSHLYEICGSTLLDPFRFCSLGCKEVSLMKRLRHPNVLLFMGDVTSPQRLRIVTEFLSRGSLFRLLQKNAAKLEWKQR
ncbi:uncharacterized protein LOC120138005 [Hibiscus syriacus]|uniref:uncharacterized protein LOC120138005 n=1 Tax=Hibiscus syriacus TaxID=106335 RepID=UPI0019229EE7|nr:uncharacterized protein LOC120138005 [Hibiscus syriacus]